MTKRLNVTPGENDPSSTKTDAKSSRRSVYRCSFCGKSQDQVKRLIAGPSGVYICNECIDLCNKTLVYRCSFCGKTQDQVQRLVAGPGGVYICDECINLCNEIIREEDSDAPKES